MTSIGHPILTSFAAFQHVTCRTLDFSHNPRPILVDHFNDIAGWGGHQPCLDLLDALLHHLQGLVLAQILLPHLVEQTQDEIASITVSADILTVHRRQVVAPVQARPSVLVPACDEQVCVVRALSQCRGEFLPGEICNSLCAHIDSVAIRVEAYVGCDIFCKVDSVACFTRDGKHFVCVYRNNLVLVLHGRESFQVYDVCQCIQPVHGTSWHRGVMDSETSVDRPAHRFRGTYLLHGDNTVHCAGVATDHDKVLSTDTGQEVHDSRRVVTERVVLIRAR